MTKKVLAIDPGKKGGVATIAGKEVHVMPLLYDKEGVDADALFQMMCMFEPTHIVIERQWVRPGQGVVSSGTTMYNYGVLRATAAIYAGAAVFTPTPRKWQKLVIPDARKGETKEASVAFCTRRYPEVSLLPTKRSRKKSDGLADALCMAHAGVHHLEALTEIS